MLDADIVVTAADVVAYCYDVVFYQHTAAELTKSQREDYAALAALVTNTEIDEELVTTSQLESEPELVLKVEIEDEMIATSPLVVGDSPILPSQAVDMEPVPSTSAWSAAELATRQMCSLPTDKEGRLYNFNAIKSEPPEVSESLKIDELENSLVMEIQ